MLNGVSCHGPFGTMALVSGINVAQFCANYKQLMRNSPLPVRTQLNINASI
jgi:hypothetical protein